MLSLSPYLDFCDPLLSRGLGEELVGHAWWWEVGHGGLVNGGVSVAESGEQEVS